MLQRNKKTASLASIIAYTLPKLHTGKNWYIDFLAYDPLEQRLKRKKYMLDAIPKKADRKARAAELIAALHGKLRTGWTPWMEGPNSRQYTKIADVFDYYFKYLEKLYKAGTLKYNTYNDYTKRLGILKGYNENRAMPIYYAYQIDSVFISDFLDYILIDREASPRTRNNYKGCIATFCNWMIEKGYITANPCDAIKKLTTEPKYRSALTSDDLAKLKTYLEEKNPHFLLLCMFAYYTFIRPDEISHIRIKDIDVAEQKVHISSEFTKNRKDGTVGLNDAVVRLMAALHVFDAEGECYLFGRGFKPARKRANPDAYRKYFNKVREALHFTDHYQFYSLKDTGIRDLANAEGIVIARDQARHSDVHTTNKYLKQEGVVHEETKHFKGAL